MSRKLSKLSEGLKGDKVKSSFVAHSLPTVRGIFVTAHFATKGETSTEELLEMAKSFYEGSPFVRVREGSPQLVDVVGTNFCDMSVLARGNQVVAMAAIDNLVKGMAGQAIQNMNLMCGLEETAGLYQPALRII